MADKDYNTDFLREPPITGGNSYTTKQVIEAQDNVIKSTLAINPKTKQKLHANSIANTYPYWYLLQFMADYFTNLIWFRFDSQIITEACYKAIRCACIFGNSCLRLVWKDGIKIVQAYYIGNMVCDADGNPIKLKVYPAQNLFMNQAIINNPEDTKTWKKTLNYTEIDYNQNTYILNYSSCGWGGLTKWLYFIKQFQHLLKMLYTHSFSYVKSIIYNVSDTSASTDDLDIFFSSDSPFIVNLADDEVLGNRFKPFEINNDQRNNVQAFIDGFLDIYYALLGRRSNIDFKKERNINSEIAMSQDNFDTLQNEFKTYITLMIEWVSKKIGLEIIYNRFEGAGLPSVEISRGDSNNE